MKFPCWKEIRARRKEALGIWWVNEALGRPVTFTIHTRDVNTNGPIGEERLAVFETGQTLTIQDEVGKTFCVIKRIGPLSFDILISAVPMSDEERLQSATQKEIDNDRQRTD